MEDDMGFRIATASLAAASLLAIAACDSRDYEAEIATLESDLQTSRSESEQLQTELDGLRAQAEALPEGALETVQTELNNVVQTAATTFDRMGEMTEEPDAPAEQRTEALTVLRQDLQTIVQSVQVAAQDLGLELETVTMDTDAGAMEGMPEPEPAAGSGTEQQEPAAASEEPPANAQ
jgi:chromosome segregation ATPase